MCSDAPGELASISVATALFVSFRVSRRRAFVSGARGGDKSRDALRRTGRDAVSSPRATPRIKVAQQPASTRPAFVVARVMGMLAGKNFAPAFRAPPPAPPRPSPRPSARRTLVSSYSKKLAELCGGYNEVRLREVLHVACDKFCVPRNRGAVEHLVVRIREWLV